VILGGESFRPSGDEAMMMTSQMQVDEKPGATLHFRKKNSLRFGKPEKQIHSDFRVSERKD